MSVLQLGPDRVRARRLAAVRWANAALRDGGEAEASAIGVALSVSAVTVSGGMVVALTRPGAGVPTLADCDDVPGDLALLRRDRRRVLDVRLQGWWRPLTTVEVAGRAADLAGVAQQYAERSTQPPPRRIAVYDSLRGLPCSRLSSSVSSSSWSMTTRTAHRARARPAGSSAQNGCTRATSSTTPCSVRRDGGHGAQAELVEGAEGLELIGGGGGRHAGRHHDPHAHRPAREDVGS